VSSTQHDEECLALSNPNQCHASRSCRKSVVKNFFLTRRASHHGAENAVRENDVFFALHALLMTSLTLGQVGIYERGSQRVSTLCCWAVGGAMAVIVFYAGTHPSLNVISPNFTACKLLGPGAIRILLPECQGARGALLE